MTRVYIADLPAGVDRVEVSGDEAHYLTRVVRVRAGEAVGVFDGRGHEWRARVETVGRQSVGLVLAGVTEAIAEPPIAVTLAVGVLKGDQMDAVVRDATVMGVTRIVPLATEHVTVPSRAWRDERGLDRWHRVAVAAARQCGRALVPAIAPVTAFGRVWDGAPAAGESAIALACVEPAAAGHVAPGVPSWRSLPRPASVIVLVGPEGGWSEGERAALADRQVPAVSLGPRTLRAESVPIVVLTLLWATWGCEVPTSGAG